MTNPSEFEVLLWPPMPSSGMTTGAYPNGAKVVHKPSGLSEACVEHREHYKNKATALSRLQNRLSRLNRR